jgi:hypothetical protein
MASVNQAEFAALMGWSGPYVTKLKKAGRLVMTAAGQVDVEASKVRIAETRDPSRDDVVSRRPVPAPVQVAVEPDDKDIIVDFQTARAIKENYLARQAKIDYEERTGKLVDAEKLAQAQFELARQVRDSMLAITPRLQDVLASITDPLECGRVLSAEIRQALESAAKQAGDLDDNLVAVTAGEEGAD